MDPIDIHCMDKKKSLCGDIFQNIFFCVPQKTVSRTNLERHEDE